VVSTGYPDAPASHPSNRRVGDRVPARPTRKRALIGLELLIAVCGLGGGIYLSTHPTTALSLTYLHGTWFHSWQWPGLALMFFVGVCPLLVAVAALRGRRIASIGHLCVGVGLIAWVVLEAAWIVVSPGLQIVVGAIGALILVLGAPEWLPSDHGPRTGESE